MKKQPIDLKIFALGGLGVVGMNMYCVEMGKEIIVMDCGILFAEGDAPASVTEPAPELTPAVDEPAPAADPDPAPAADPESDRYRSSARAEGHDLRQPQSFRK